MVLTDLRLARALALTAVWAATACAPDAPEALPTVRAEGPPAEWVLDSVPVVTIGEESGPDPDYLLNQVGDVRLLPGGEVAMVREFRSVEVFDSAGRWVRSFGRGGDGPDEFQYLRRLFRNEDETLVAVDQARVRITEWEPAGTRRAAWRWTPFPFESRAGLAVLDRRLLAVTSQPLRDAWEPGQHEVRVPSALVAVGEEGMDTLTVVPEARTFLVRDGPEGWHGSVLLPVPRLGSWGGGVAFTDGKDQGMVEFYDRMGALVARVETGTWGAPLTPEVVEAHREERGAARRAVTGGADPPIQSPDPEWPDRLPAYDAVLKDGAECVWLKHFRVPGEAWIPTFDVVHPERGLVATVTAPGPSPMRVRDIRGDRVAVHMTDELGVERVAILRLHRIGGSGCT